MIFASISNDHIHQQSVDKLLVLTIPAFSCVAADQVPSFEQVYASDGKNELTAWGHRYARGVGVAKDTQ